jgi:uncharacterized protein with PCYCGC motif
VNSQKETIGRSSRVQRGEGIAQTILEKSPPMGALSRPSWVTWCGGNEMTDGIARRRFLTQMSLGLGVVALGGSFAWWGSAPAGPTQRKTPSGDLLETVPQGGLPTFARTGGPTVEAVYRYAVEHGETLQYIPCVCGCGAIGHRHNADCYVAERLPDGAVTFTNHGAR